MAEFTSSNTTATMASQTSQSLLMPMLESTVPGLSLITRFLSHYLNIDISQHLGLLLILLGLGTAFNYCYERANGIIEEHLCSTAKIEYNDEIYNYLMHWISKNGLSKRTTKFIAGTQISNSHYRSYDSDEEGDEYEMDDDSELNDEALKRIRNWDRVKNLKFTPATGEHYFYYRKRLIKFTRSQETKDNYWGSSMKEQVSLSCYGRNTQILKDLLHEAQLAYLERDGNRTVIYRASKPYAGSDVDWCRLMARPPRPMSTVVLEEEQKTSILKDMKEYLHPRTKKWYSNRGIPYRRGYLLHGPPGTGKTSLCFALAGVLQLRLYVANLNSKNMTEDALSTLFHDLPARCIVLLEDIDAAGLAITRKEEKPKEETRDKEGENKGDDSVAPRPDPNQEVENKGISLSGFLNIIDGVASNEGRILVMTTNHMEKLDAALLRPGRVDHVVHFTFANYNMIKGLFMAIYSTVEAEETKNDNDSNGKPTVAPRRDSFIGPHGKAQEEIEELSKKFAEKLPANKHSPAEIQGYLLGHKTDPVGAVEGLDKWLAEKSEAKNKTS